MGTFTESAGSPYPVGKGPYQIVAADINGDGKLDLAVINLRDGTVSTLLQQVSSAMVSSRTVSACLEVPALAPVKLRRMPSTSSVEPSAAKGGVAAECFLRLSAAKQVQASAVRLPGGAGERGGELASRLTARKTDGRRPIGLTPAKSLPTSVEYSAPIQSIPVVFAFIRHSADGPRSVVRHRLSIPTKSLKTRTITFSAK